MDGRIALAHVPRDLAAHFALQRLRNLSKVLRQSLVQAARKGAQRSLQSRMRTDGVAGSAALHPAKPQQTELLRLKLLCHAVSALHKLNPGIKGIDAILLPGDMGAFAGNFDGQLAGLRHQRAAA